MEFTVMSPGLDGWRREQRLCSSSRNASMHPCRSRSCSPERLPVERENGQGGEGPLKSVGGNIDDNLKTDRVRAIRYFKFALVEYLKDLLKPYWKEGRLSRAAHKIIVKKSAKKVIESFGNSDIPSDYKIDSYLICSHSKLSKLVQAYVEKYQKG